MKAKRGPARWMAMSLLAASCIGIGCVDQGQIPESLGMLSMIRSDHIITSIIPDTLVMVPGSISGDKMMQTPKDTGPIPVPPDHRCGLSEIFFFKSPGDSVIEVMKTKVTPDCMVKVFQKWQPGEEYYIVRKIKIPSRPVTDQTQK
jgi:hypothetical protein